MHITSIDSDQWDLMDRGIDRETALPMCHVRHRTASRVVVYRLVQHSDGWRKVGDIMPHFKGFRRYPERRGVRLSNSRLDLTLSSFCERGHGNAHA